MKEIEYRKDTTVLRVFGVLKTTIDAAGDLDFLIWSLQYSLIIGVQYVEHFAPCFYHDDMVDSVELSFISLFILTLW